MLSKDFLQKKASLVCWTVAIGAYFFQFPFSKLSALILPCIFAYIFVSIPKIKILKSKPYLILFGVFVVLIAAQCLRGLIEGTDFGRILRFAAILLVIPFSATVSDDSFSDKKEVFLNLAMVKAVILIFFGAIIVHFGDFGYFRAWAFDNALGDIYFLNRFIPKVQVHGNALLIIAFMIDCLDSKKITLRKITLLAGVLVAGNFAFILALLAFFGWQAGIKAVQFIKSNKKAKYVVIACAVAAAAVLVPYFITKIVEKSASSNVVRLEQAKILLDANPFIGEGLGCWVTASNDVLNYNGDIYFELQTLYIYRQIGFVLLALFYAVVLIPVWKKGKSPFIFYLVYLFYSFWNPYCFDVTQIITTIIVMNCAISIGGNDDKGSYYSLPSWQQCKEKYNRYRKADR